MEGSYLGNKFSQNEIEKELKSLGANFETLNYEDLIVKNGVGNFKGKNNWLVSGKNGIWSKSFG